MISSNFFMLNKLFLLSGVSDEKGLSTVDDDMILLWFVGFSDLISIKGIYSKLSLRHASMKLSVFGHAHGLISGK